MMSSILDGLRQNVPDRSYALDELTGTQAYGWALNDVREALTNPPSGVLDDMLDACDGHTSLRVDPRVDGYICVAPGCGVRSDTAEQARQHAMAAALTAAGGDDA